MSDPTTKKIVDEMIASGAKRLDPGDVYETPLPTRITVVSGYAAAEGSRVVCTGAMTSHRQTNGLKVEDAPAKASTVIFKGGPAHVRIAGDVTPSSSQAFVPR